MANTTTLEVKTEQDAPRRRSLNQLHDRCDRCRAQAFVAVTAPSATTGKGVELLFCGHHYRRHEEVFAAKGYPVHDERHLINEAPSVSANA